MRTYHDQRAAAHKLPSSMSGSYGVVQLSLPGRLASLAASWLCGHSRLWLSVVSAWSSLLLHLSLWDREGWWLSAPASLYSLTLVSGLDSIPGLLLEYSGGQAGLTKGPGHSLGLSWTNPWRSLLRILPCHLTLGGRGMKSRGWLPTPRLISWIRGLWVVIRCRWSDNLGCHAGWIVPFRNCTTAVDVVSGSSPTSVKSE